MGATLTVDFISGNVFLFDIVGGGSGGTSGTTFQSIIGDPLDNTSLKALFDSKIDCSDAYTLPAILCGTTCVSSPIVCASTCMCGSASAWNGYNNCVLTQAAYDLLTPSASVLYFICE